MVNILVPTDFSELSNNATKFAIKIANKLNGTVTLIHVMTAVTPVRASMQERIQKIEKELIEEANENLEAVAHSFARQVRFTEPIRRKIARGSGSFEETLKKEAKKLRAGLIIMGTHGASGLKKVMMGSNTTAVIGSSTIPVLAIPKAGEFKSFRNVIYASNLKNTEKELKLLIPYVEKSTPRCTSCT
jgi:nucleotide-binding universal stress UspA family protein